LAANLGIAENETAVIGDWYNDVSMFELDVLKVAVSNAVKVIRDAADIITDKTNNEDAVAEFLQLVQNSRET